MKPRSFNPLDYATLSDTLSRELMSSELVPLEDIEEFYGGGVYALFYSGDFDPYVEMAEQNFARPGSMPIYIGKAEPKTLSGSGFDASIIDTPQAGKPLYKRIAKDHRKSIEQACNLSVEDFSCRLLVLNAVWVPLCESALIGKYVPIWNSIVPGFGNHPPGSGRSAGKISKWDILHPGRGRETGAAPASTYEDIAAGVRHAIRERRRLSFPDDLIEGLA